MLIDLSTPEITLSLGSAHRYSKCGTVQARMAVEREEVVTTLANGLEETRNVAAPGDWVVTNPTGEVYVLSDETFNKRYYGVVGDKYYARGMCRAIVNPYPHPIEILAPWGRGVFA
jgi:PGDYG protein